MRRWLLLCACILLAASLTHALTKLTPEAEEKVLASFKELHPDDRDSAILELREKGIDPTFLTNYVESRRTHHRNMEIAGIVITVVLVCGGAYLCFRLITAGWRRRSRATGWLSEHGDVVSNRMSDSRRAKRELLRYQELEALSKLHRDGVIDDEEFEKRKRIALGEEPE